MIDRETIKRIHLPSDEQLEEIQEKARKSYLRHHSSIRGQLITASDSPDSHLIWEAWKMAVATVQAEWAKGSEPMAWLDTKTNEVTVKAAMGPFFGGMCGTNIEPLYLHPQPAIPAGWKLVPVEPTVAMKDAPDVRVSAPCHGCSDSQVGWSDCADIYRAMLAAAPEPTK